LPRLVLPLLRLEDEPLTAAALDLLAAHLEDTKARSRRDLGA